jgi:sugar phosphate isomerase/epimerase
MVSRRSFLRAGSSAAALCAFGRARQLQAIGVQLYTVRNVLPEKPAETLRAIEAIGYREVEATFATLDAIWPSLKATSLKPVSMHLDSKDVTKGSGDNLSRVVDKVKAHGFEYAVFPYLPPDERGGLDVIRKLAATLNAAGERCRAAGLHFCYHNHAFEFQPMGGTFPFKVLLEETDPKLVGIEMDCFWVSVAGHDPVEVLKAHGSRIPLLHLKDKAKDTPVRYNESVPKATFKEVGNGVIDWPAVLSAAAAENVQHYFVEQDQTPGNPVDSLKASYGYLSKLNY